MHLERVTFYQYVTAAYIKHQISEGYYPDIAECYPQINEEKKIRLW